MSSDVSVEFHGQHARLESVVGVKAGFELFTVGSLMPNGVGVAALNRISHQSFPVWINRDTWCVLGAIAIDSCLRFNAS